MTRWQRMDLLNFRGGGGGGPNLVVRNPPPRIWWLEIPPQIWRKQQDFRRIKLCKILWRLWLSWFLAPICFGIFGELPNQQFTCGVVSERVFLPKVCGNSAETSRFLLGWHFCRTKLARIVLFQSRIFSRKCSEIFPEFFEPLIPRGPKDQKNSRFRSRLKISIENEIFERATHRGPIFCGEIETSRLKFSSEIKNFDRDWKFQARLNFFDRWALWVCGSEKIPQNSRKFSFPKIKKIHRRASAGAQGEIIA